VKIDLATKQADLIVTPEDQPSITVDGLEVAQFIYLLLNNQRIRQVIDTIGKKAVLILGRFTPERKAVLDTIRQWLREHDYLPILFDFDVPSERDVTETITLLARMARLIIADLTAPSSIPKELEANRPNSGCSRATTSRGLDHPVQHVQGLPEARLGARASPLHDH
jgi:hypothetical protein